MITNKIFEAVYTNYQNAIEMIQLKKPDLSLVSSRKALEVLVRVLGGIYGIDMNTSEGEAKLIDCIDTLEENGVFDSSDTKIMHRIRILGNAAAHDDGSMVEAQEAVELLQQVIEKMELWSNEAEHANCHSVNDIPMTNPNYYSPTRRYYGKWSNCYTREDLEVIPDYVALKEKADDGDISSMLDLAVGFLPKNIVWSTDHHIVCMPKYYYKGQEYFQEDAYDTRYYYWIFRACYTCVSNGNKPNKYIATALLEATKYGIATFYDNNVNLYVSGVKRTNAGETPLCSSQYELVKTLYGYVPSDVDMTFSFMSALEQLVNEYGRSIIAPVHEEREINGAIHSLMLCTKYICSEYEFCFGAHVRDTSITSEDMEGMKHSMHYDETVRIVDALTHRTNRSKFVAALEDTPIGKVNKWKKMTEMQRASLSLIFIIITFFGVINRCKYDTPLQIAGYILGGLFLIGAPYSAQIFDDDSDFCMRLKELGTFGKIILLIMFFLYSYVALIIKIYKVIKYLIDHK